MKAYLSTVTLSVILLSGCTGFSYTLNGNQDERSDITKSTDGTLTNQTSNTSVEIPPTPKTYGQFNTETLYSLMVAELASSRKRYDLTLNNYIKEAHATGDLAIISRATRFAQYFKKTDQALAMAKLWQTKEPDNTEVLAILASAYIDKRQPLQALNYAEKIIALIPASDTEAIKQVGITETIANFSRDTDTLSKETLISRYLDLIKRYPNYTAIKVGLSVLYESQQETAKAYQIIQDAITQESDYLPALMQEVRLLQSSNQTEVAIEKLKALLDKQPGNGRLRLLYARILTQVDINAAYEEFTLLAEQSPQHLDIHFSRALIALEIKKLDTAKGIFNDLLAKNYKPNTLYFYLGNIAEIEKDDSEALRFYSRVKTGNDFVIAHSRAAQILSKQGKIQEARNNFKRLRLESPQLRPQLYNAEASMLESIGRLLPALELVSEGINDYPDDVNLRYTRSSLYEQNNELANMENDLRHALTIEPENATTLNALGYFLTNRTDRHEEALGLIDKALKLRPKDPAIMDSMGWVLFNLGQIEEAIHYLRKAFELFPDPEVAAHLGEALWVDGNRQEAKTIWNQNLEKNPNDKRIIDTMERLQVKPYN